MSDFVICINSDSNPASLILGKVYRTLSDAEAEARNMLRVIDEDKSELDGYLYPLPCSHLSICQKWQGER